MHRRTRANLLPLDTELERTIRNLKKEIIVAEAPVMVEQRVIDQNISVVVADRPQ